MKSIRAENAPGATACDQTTRLRLRRVELGPAEQRNAARKSSGGVGSADDAAPANARVVFFIYFFLSLLSPSIPPKSKKGQ